MLQTFIAASLLIFLGYFFRRNFRRAFYVFRKGKEPETWRPIYREWYGDEKGERLWQHDHRVPWSGF